MLGTFVEKLSGFVDRRFVIAYWGPTLIGLGLAAGLIATLIGPAIVFAWWMRRSVTEQILFGAVALLGVTMLAYLLVALAFPLVRFYEGYWPAWMRRLWSILGLQQALNAQIHSGNHTRPRRDDLVRPTRLGNILAAAEEHAYQIYRLDTVIWWPRLVTLLPEGFQAQLDAALTPMLALLNLSTQLGLLGALGGIAVLLVDDRWWLFVMVFGGGMVLARACYLAAVNQALDYGTLVGVAFDLYRHEILKHMHIPAPDNLEHERLLWESLNSWIEGYTMPWETPATAQVKQLARPFYYDTHTPPSAPDNPQEIFVTIRQSPDPTPPSPDDGTAGANQGHADPLPGSSRPSSSVQGEAHA